MAKTAKKPAPKAKAAKKVSAPGPRALSMARTIQVKGDNPRRPGTAAHKYHSVMAKSPTVAKYLGKFSGKERRDASLWLSTAARQGHVKFGKAA